MTVGVAFLCPDGVVIAADSMLTPSIGGMGVGHHTGQKVYHLPGDQVIGIAGDIGLAMRFKTLVEVHPASAGMPPAAPGGARIPFPTGLDYTLLLSQAINDQFTATKVPNRDGANCVLGFPLGGQPQCAVFWGGMQPMMLDPVHYYMALGSGKLSADPFLKFLVDIFCQGRRPSVREAIFLATWTVQHTIDTNSGGVADPIRVVVMETAPVPAAPGTFVARELPDPEIQEHLGFMKDAENTLRTWIAAINTGAAAQGAAPVPVPAPAPAQQAAAVAVAPAPQAPQQQS